MKRFAQLILELESTNKILARIDALVRYFQEAPEDDSLWVIALFTGKRPKRAINTNYLREWILEETGLPAWLFIEAYSSVGDLGETMSLVLPAGHSEEDFSLSEWMNKIADLKNQSEEEKKQFVRHHWRHLDITERLIFNKLIGGSFRIGVSSKMLINALAKYSGQEANLLAHSIMGKWEPKSVSFRELLDAENINPDNSKPYPFCLAYPLEKEIQELGQPEEWIAEYKWDGIRGQFIKRNNEVHIWSRGEELVTDHFPEIAEILAKWEGDFVLDGEILPVKNNEVLNFNELQKRLNRKTISKKMLEEIPVSIYLYDILESEQEDLRNKLFGERRKILEDLFTQNSHQGLYLSESISFQNWEDLPKIREEARLKNSEGLMLKNKSSLYHAGRKKGNWWKWKVDPLTIDAVLIYAQKGSGRRSSYYTDYTFAVKKGEELVTVAKAYSGLTDKEIMEVSKFVNKNAIEKFGPVRTVKPELVFEIGFEGIALSNRHKSGVALRFPRILRWRKDKTVTEIDDIEEIKKLIK